ncbi:MAG: rod shape-determining protein MreC [Brevundimonas sp.]|uniref:rod shape-determining protein MreC n=1 Tax=Brevundimonas sp. TaxID=1871086 RepID=UPI0039E6848C
MAFRDGPFENLKVPLVWTAAVVVVAAVVASVLLLLNDQRASGDQAGYGTARATTDAVAGPVGGVFAAPVRWAGAASDYVGGYFFAVSENRKLKQQLSEFQQQRDQVIALKNVNARYEVMLGVRTEPPVPMATARSISESRGPFNRARLLDVGSAKGVTVGNPVINEHGLVGRIIGTSTHVSRMLHLTDVASQTPVLIARSDARAILKGDGSGNPRLEFVRGFGAIEVGDRVLTSGDGGGFPRGLPIGVAAKGIDGSWRVKLFSDRGAIDYVRVMLFQDFGQLLESDDLNAAPLAGLISAPSPTAAQAAAITDAAARRAAVSAEATTRNSGATAARPTPTPTPAPPPAARPTTTAAATTTPAPAPARPRPSGPRPYQPATPPATTPPAAATPPQPGADG